MMKKSSKIKAILMAMTLATLSTNVYAEAVTSKMDLSKVILESQAKNKWKPEYAQQGCSEEAWTNLQKAQLQTLNDYQTKSAAVDQAILKAGTIMPSSLGLNGCLSSVSDIMNKYVNVANDISRKVESANSSLGGLLGGLFGDLWNSAKAKLKQEACQYINGKIADAEAKIFNESGLGNVLNAGDGILNNPFGTLENKIHGAIEKQFDSMDKN